MRGVSLALLLAIPAWGHFNPWLKTPLMEVCSLKLKGSSQITASAKEAKNPIPEDPGTSLAELAHKLSEALTPPKSKPIPYPESVHKYKGLDLTWTSDGKDGKPYVAYGKSRYGDILIYADKDIVSMKIIQKDSLKLGQVLDGDAIAYLVHIEKNLKFVAHTFSKVNDSGFKHMAYPHID